jgi:hypothetical protein
MKKIIRNNRILALAFFTLFTTVVSAAGKPVTNNPAVPAELILIGNFNDQPVIKLNIAGDAEKNDFFLSITDVAGETLYTENIKGENFSKKFLFNFAEIGDSKLYFKVTCRNNNKTVVYEISNNETYAKNTVLVKK